MKKGLAWLAAWGLAACAAVAGETVVDRQGAWQLVQDGEGGVKTLHLEKVGGGERALLAEVEVPVATVTNAFWDEYAGRDEATGRAVGGMVERVDTVAAEYRFRGFVNDGQAYWEDWEEGVARLWTAPCASPESKTLLAEKKDAAQGAESAFGARAWQRGAAWTERGAKGTRTMVYAKDFGTKQVPAMARTAAKNAGKAGLAPRYSGSGDYYSSGDYSGSGDYYGSGDYSGSGYYGSGDYSGSGDYYDSGDYSGSGDYYGSGEGIFFDANGGLFTLEGGEEVEILENAASYYMSGGEGYISINRYDDFLHLAREDHAFDGWYAERTGGEPCSVWTAESLNEERTYYAHWISTGGVELAAAADAAPLSFTTGGDGVWFGQTAEAHDGSDAARSGLATGTGETWMETTVEGPGTVSFWWKASCDEGYEDYEGWDEYGNPIGDPVMRYWICAAFSLDGEELAKLGGDSGWQKAEFEVGEGSHALRWTYGGEDNFLSDGHACAWVDQVEWSGAAPEQEAVAFDECTMESSGGAGTFKFKFHARAGKTYELQKTEDLTAGEAGWTAVRTVTVSEDGSMDMDADIREGEGAGYFRMAEKE